MDLESDNFGFGVIYLWSWRQKNMELEPEIYGCEV